MDKNSNNLNVAGIIISNTTESKDKSVLFTPAVIISIISAVVSFVSLCYTYHSSIISDNTQHLVIPDINKADKNNPYVWNLQVNSGAVSKITWYRMYDGSITLAETSSSPQNVPVSGKQKNQKYDITGVRLYKDNRINHYTYNFFALASDFQGNSQLYMLLITGYNKSNKKIIPIKQAKNLRVEWIDPSKIPLINSKTSETAGQSWYIDQIKLYYSVLNQFKKYDLVK
ncbi:MAG: hypothetical protein ABF709_04070 [Leuconostoc pseudomesenteroides]|uniref:hypothetical protein n=1 Tax=Leuconostoc pseudomesenteroides TaxID=33968 RepID=UPI0039E98608